jgi:uncharacterized iron-regulated membrane protein
LIVTVVSGLAWSTYWGPTFTAAANEISPNAWTEAPVSVLGTRSDLDRFGNQLSWNTGDQPLPASLVPPTGSAPPVDATELPAAMSLDRIADVASEVGMRDGFTISLPTNAVDDTGAVTYGSFALTNSWPRKTSETRSVYLDQFTGRTLSETNVYGYGSVSKSMDTMVSVHMGTELGIANRIVMTAVCVLALWSSGSATVMYAKRRRPGTAGLPRRPADVRLGRRTAVIGATLGVLFPLWAVSALMIGAVDRYVIRRSSTLRPRFGQR